MAKKTKTSPGFSYMFQDGITVNQHTGPFAANEAYELYMALDQGDMRLIEIRLETLAAALGGQHCADGDDDDDFIPAETLARKLEELRQLREPRRESMRVKSTSYIRSFDHRRMVEVSANRYVNLRAARRLGLVAKLRRRHAIGL